MTAERLDDLLDLLHADGWLLINSRDMHVICSDDHLHWELEHPQAGATVELLFYAVGDLGERTDQLKDIRSCRRQGDEFKLAFVKRTSPEWLAGVRSFVEAIRP